MFKVVPTYRIVFFYFFLLFSTAAQAGHLCRHLFELGPEPKTIEDYLELSEDRHSLRLQPRFVNPSQEVEIEKNWTIEKAPKIVEEALPEGVGAINHALYQAQPGVIKIDGTGLMVSVRANLNYKGKSLGTNVAVSSNALFSNLGRTDKYLARQDAKAVIIFLHGGGTKSTGHHVAANMMNYMGSYNVDVIALDQPWHGEGPRHFFNNADEYFDYLLEFFKKYIPPNVPVIVSGHSMGGTYADMILRRSDTNPKIKKVVTGIVSLSNVPDLAPGKSFQEKINAEREREKDPKIKANMVGEDKYLMDSLVEKAKVSPVASYDIQNMFADNDWTLPADKGANYLPSIHIMGDQDFLYTGLEEHFKTYVGGLVNGNFIVYPKVGHIIFSDDTTFDHIRDFISKLRGESLPKIHNVRGSSKTGMIQRLIETYLNNLAFREFVKDYEISNKIGKEEVNELKEKLTALNQYLAQAGQLKKKNKQMTAADLDAVLPRPLNLTDDQMREEISRLESLFKSSYVPADSNKEFAVSNIARREAITADLLSLSKERTALKDQSDKLAVSKKRLEKQRANLFGILQRISLGRDITAEEEVVFKSMKIPVKLGSALQESENALEELLELYEKINLLNSEYIGRLINENRRTEQALIQIPVDISELYQKYQLREKRYQIMVSQAESIFNSEAARGNINEDVLKLSREIYQTTKNWEEQAEKLYNVEIQILRLQAERQNLLQLYIETITPQMFYYERVKLLDLLNLNYNEIQDWLGSLESAWKTWSTLWREKPQSDAGGLY